MDFITVCAGVQYDKLLPGFRVFLDKTSRPIKLKQFLYLQDEN